MALDFTQTTTSQFMPSKRIKLGPIDTSPDSVPACVTAERGTSTATPSPVYRKFSINSNTASKSPTSVTSLDFTTSSSQSSSVQPSTKDVAPDAGGHTATIMADLAATENHPNPADRLSTRRNRKPTAKAKELAGTKFYPIVATDERRSQTPSTPVVSSDATTTQDSVSLAPTPTASNSILVSDNVGTPGISLEPSKASAVEPAVETPAIVDSSSKQSTKDDLKKKTPIKLSLFIKSDNQNQQSQKAAAKSLCNDDRSNGSCIAPASAHGSFVTLHVNWRKFSRLARQKRSSMSVASLMANQLQKPPKPSTKPKKEPSADADTTKSTPTLSARDTPIENPPTKTNLSFRNRGASATTKPQAEKPETENPLFCGLTCLDPTERLLAWAKVAAKEDLSDDSDAKKPRGSSPQAVQQALQSFCRCSASATSKVKGRKAKAIPKQTDQPKDKPPATTSNSMERTDTQIEDAPSVDDDTIVVDVSVL